MDQTLRAVVIGTPLGRLHELAVPLAAVGMSVSDAEAAAKLDLSPLYFQAGDLLGEIGGAWWRMSTEDPPRLESIVALAPGRQVDDPRMAWRTDTHIVIGGISRDVQIPASAELVLGPGNSAAWSLDATTWRIYTPPAVVSDVAVPDGSKVIGLADIGGPQLVALSTGGLIARLVSPTQTRTLTRWSGGTGEPVLHPSQPWLAVPRPGGLIEVADLAANHLLRTIRSSE